MSATTTGPERTPATAETETETGPRARPDRRVWAAMLVGSVASLVASFVLAVDAIRLAEDPTASLGCDINAVISCGTVANSWQASLLGFPNAFLGLMFEPMVITLAVGALSGVRFPRHIMFTAQIVYTIALAFAYWLFHQAMFEIGALCPWCLLVTLATTLVWFEMTRVNVLHDNLFLPRRMQSALHAAVRSGLDVVVGVSWVLLMVLVVVLRYGEALFA